MHSRNITNLLYSKISARPCWYLRDFSKVKIEIPVDRESAEPWHGAFEDWRYQEIGEILVVIQVKRM
jgi:hypothetical protein